MLNSIRFTLLATFLGLLLGVSLFGCGKVTHEVNLDSLREQFVYVCRELKAEDIDHCVAERMDWVLRSLPRVFKAGGGK